MKFTSSILICLLYFFLLNTAMLHAHSSCCPTPAQGSPGPMGPQGPTGPQGPQGPQGSADSDTFASVSLENSQVVAFQTAVIFDLVHIVEGDISYNNTTGEFTLMNTGFYRVKYGISGSPNNKQLALQLNGGTIVPGSTIDTQSSVMQGIGVIFEATVSMSTLRLINNETSGNITLSSTSAGSTDAYLVIEKL